jgi:hypothetical protein
MTFTLIKSGISEADKTGAPVNERGILLLKLAMFILPLLCILAGYIVYRTKYKIDKKFYVQIVSVLAPEGISRVTLWSETKREGLRGAASFSHRLFCDQIQVGAEIAPAGGYWGCSSTR